ncbi:MAG: EAL domain-containing protein [Erysipelotrichaceae bacterium]
MKNNKKKIIQLYLGILVFIVIVSISALLYVTRLNDMLKKENDVYVNEVNSAIASRVDLMVDSHLNTISVLAAQMNESNLSNGDAILSYMRNTKEIVTNKSLGVLDKNGELYAAMGYRGNKSKVDYYKLGMAKKQSLTYIHRKTGVKAFTVGTPILSDEGEVMGVLMEAIEDKEFFDLLATKHFDNQGQVSLVDSNGNIIVHEQGKEMVFEQPNIFNALATNSNLDEIDLKDIEADFALNGSNSFEYYINGTKYYTSYMPIKYNNWKVAVTFPVSAMQNSGKDFIYSTAFICFAIIIAFVSLVAYILYIQRKHNTKLEKIAYVDGITGLDNWNAFKIKAKENFKINTDKKYAMIYLDIRRFKIINDMYGYTAGDLTIKYIGETINKSLNEGEVFTRLFADKFNIIMEYISDDIIIERFSKLIKDINSFQNTATSFEIIISAGIYRISDLTMSISLMSDRANIAKKEIKNTHVSDYKFYQEDIRNKMIKENELETHMQDAINNDEFIIFLQPKYDVNTLIITGAEALVRWKTSTGLLLPDDFIPLFEENGFIVEMDKYIFENVCKMLRRWIDQGVDPVCISVNLSKVHFRNLSFLNEYQSIIDRYGVPTKYIELEITESVAVENMDILITVINRIKEIGFSCSLDDFGSGYSSLNILKEVPVDVIKLDKVFFKDSVNSRRRNKVVCSVIALAKELNMKTVSEGIETKNQLDFLRSVGCDMVQGYIFSRPISIEEFETIIINGATQKGKYN